MYTEVLPDPIINRFYRQWTHYVNKISSFLQTKERGEICIFSNKFRSQVSPSLAIHFLCIQNLGRGVVSFFNTCFKTHMGFRKIKV